MVAVIFGAGSGVLLVLNELHVHDIVLSKIAASAGSSVPGFSPSAYFNVNPGIGLLVVLVILAVAVLYNLSALIVGAGPVAMAPAAPEPQPPLAAAAATAVIRRAPARTQLVPPRNGMP